MVGTQLVNLSGLAVLSASPRPPFSYFGMLHQSRQGNAGIPQTPHTVHTYCCLPSWFFLPRVHKIGLSTLCSHPHNEVVLMLQWKETFIVPHFRLTSSSATFVKCSIFLWMLTCWFPGVTTATFWNVKHSRLQPLHLRTVCGWLPCTWTGPSVCRVREVLQKVHFCNDGRVTP